MFVVIIREGAYSASHTDTAVHAIDADGDPLCGINPLVTEPWFQPREGTDSDVTCEGCKDVMAELDEEWEEEEGKS